MFCNNCGARIPETANFCVGCGNPVKRSEAATAAPPPPAYAAPSPPPMYAPAAQPAAPAHDSRCPWCGATLEKHAAVTRSGWSQAPGRKDMAKLQFGDSFCQIEGAYVPVADMKLSPTGSVYFAHHVLLWKDPQVTITTMSMKGAWKRVFAGMPLIMTQAQGPGHVAFSQDAPGEMLALPLQAGQAVDVREHLFLTATHSVAYDWFQTGVWFTTKSGDDKETHYPLGMYMDRFSAPQAPGLLLLHAGGNVFVRQLSHGQTILVKPTSLIFKDPSVQMHLHFEHPSTGFSLWGSWSNRYMWLRLSGPGRVAVQSSFERIEGESRNISGYSYATQRQW